jgi:hypothetical protein
MKSWTSATLAEKEAAVVFNIEFNAGLVFGLNVDTVYMVEKEEDTPNFDEKPTKVIYLHLGVITIAMLLA